MLQGTLWVLPLHKQAVAQTIEIGARRALFGGKVMPSGVLGAFTHDGKRFLGAAQRVDTTGPILTLVTHWPATLGGR